VIPNRTFNDLSYLRGETYQSVLTWQNFIDKHTVDLENENGKRKMKRIHLQDVKQT
jgi:hypothetical protein